MVRLLAFALYADERLGVRPGALERKTSRPCGSGTMAARSAWWIEVGLPDERVLRKGAPRRVVLLAYGGRAAEVVVAESAHCARTLDNLTVLAVPQDASRGPAGMAERGCSCR